MTRTLKVHELLTRSELDQLEAFSREPGRTVDEVHNWVLALGYTLSRNAAWRWQKEFNATDRFKASNEVARSMVEAAKSGGAVAINEANGLRISQMLFEQMLRSSCDGDIDPKEMLAMTMSYRNVVASLGSLEKLKLDIVEAVARGEKVAKAGGSAEAALAEVRNLLSLKAA